MNREKKHPGDLHTVAGQTLWNLAGMLTPLLVALVAIPVLIDHLGKERFGVLGIVGLLIGYLSVFDLGIGQAQAYLIADARGRGEEARIPMLFQTSLILILILGAAIAGLFALGSDYVAHHVLEVPAGMQEEIERSLKVAAFAIPFAILAPCLIATLEAFQEFRIINLVRIPTSASYFLAPLLVIPFTETLPPVILAMIAGRIIETCAFFWCCQRRIHGIFGHWQFSRLTGARILKFGGWMTTSNIVLPLMIHGDRFILGALRSLVLVTYYITPAELIIRLLVLPRALVTVLFPNLTMRFAGGTAGIGDLISQSFRLLLGVLTMVVMGLILFGPWALGLWLSEDFRLSSGGILRWLSLGVLFLSLAYIPQYMIQASGRPKVTAILHLCEIPLYIGLASLGVYLGDSEGIAIAWAIRCALDLGMMLLLARRYLPDLRQGLRPILWRLAVVMVFLTGLALWPDGTGFPLAQLTWVPVTLALVWFGIFGQAERAMLLMPVKRWIRS